MPYIDNEEVKYKIRNHFAKLQQSLAPPSQKIEWAHPGFIFDQDNMIRRYMRNLTDFTIFKEYRWWRLVNWWDVMEHLVISWLCGGMAFLFCVAIGGLMWAYLSVMIAGSAFVTTFMVLFLMACFTWIGYLFI
jgi:hypothetical protein